MARGHSGVCPRARKGRRSPDTEVKSGSVHILITRHLPLPVPTRERAGAEGPPRPRARDPWNLPRVHTTAQANWASFHSRLSTSALC